MSCDITFCDGKNCPQRDQCHRYRELLRYRADKNPNRPHLISMCGSVPAKCTLFWEEKEEYN